MSQLNVKNFPCQSLALPFGDTNDLLATYGSEETEEEEGGTRVYAKKDSQLYGANRHEKFVSSQFMKKYIHVARNIKVCMGR